MPRRAVRAQKWTLTHNAATRTSELSIRSARAGTIGLAITDELLNLQPALSALPTSCQRGPTAYGWARPVNHLLLGARLHSDVKKV
jgi:hypothetical protein